MKKLFLLLFLSQLSFSQTKIITRVLYTDSIRANVDSLRILSATRFYSSVRFDTRPTFNGSNGVFASDTSNRWAPKGSYFSLDSTRIPYLDKSNTFTGTPQTMKRLITTDGITDSGQVVISNYVAQDPALLVKFYRSGTSVSNGIIVQKIRTDGAPAIGSGVGYSTWMQTTAGDSMALGAMSAILGDTALHNEYAQMLFRLRYGGNFGGGQEYVLFGTGEVVINPSTSILPVPSYGAVLTLNNGARNKTIYHDYFLKMFNKDSTLRLGIDTSGYFTTNIVAPKAFFGSSADLGAVVNSNGSITSSGSITSLNSDLIATRYNTTVAIGSVLRLRASNGTLASTLALGAAANLGQIIFEGIDTDGSSTFQSGATIRGYTTNAWTSTDHSSELRFLTISTGGTALSTRWRISSQGDLITGAPSAGDNLYDIGAVSASRPRTGYFATSLYSALVRPFTTGVGDLGAYNVEWDSLFVQDVKISNTLTSGAITSTGKSAFDSTVTNGIALFSTSNIGHATIGTGDSVQVTVQGLTTATGEAGVLGYKRTGATSIVVADTIASFDINTNGKLSLYGKYGWIVSYWIGRR